MNIYNAYRQTVMYMQHSICSLNKTQSYKYKGHFQNSAVCNSKGPVAQVPNIHFPTNKGQYFSEKNIQNSSACLRITTMNHKLSTQNGFSPFIRIHRATPLMYSRQKYPTLLVITIKWMKLSTDKGFNL
jgi:hypothetical protein